MFCAAKGFIVYIYFNKEVSCSYPVQVYMICDIPGMVSEGVRVETFVSGCGCVCEFLYTSLRQALTGCEHI